MGKGFLTYSTAVILQAVGQRLPVWFRHYRHHRRAGRDRISGIAKARECWISRLEVGRTEYRSGRTTATSQVLRSHSRRPRGAGRSRKALPFSGTDAARQEARDQNLHAHEVTSVPSHPNSKRLSTRPHLRLIALVGVIVPRRLRADWRQEWEAELRYREMLLEEWERLDWHNKLDLLRRSTSAFWDALWLQQLRWEDEMIQDLRYAVRMLLTNPGFTAVVVLTLALGIGANAALFSVVNGVLLNPLPYPQPEQLVTLHQSKPNFETGAIPYLNFRDWQKGNQTFSAMAISRGFGFSLTGTGEAERVNARLVTADFFSVLGVRPALGRTFSPGEDERGREPVVVISAGLWQRKLSSAADAVGKALTLNDKPYTIVGVLPASFSFGTADVYVPIGQWNNPGLENRRAALGLHGIGRLKPGVTFDQAQADMDRVSLNLAEAYPDTNKNNKAKLVPAQREAGR